jgi:hypothetical protein
MENDMIENWNDIKGALVTFNEKTQNRPYLTEKEMEKFEVKMKRSLRNKKLKRILNI